MEPMSARCRPTCWSSKRGHKIPGVSKSSKVLFKRIQWLPFVTPGLFPVFAQALPAKELIKVDFPTFGMPTTIVRMGRFKIPLRRSLSIFSLHASCCAVCTCFKVPLLRASIFTTWMPMSSNIWAHLRVSVSSARSALFNRTILAFPAASLSISGLRLEKGTLASTSSITKSISLISSCIALLALVI